MRQFGLIGYPLSHSFSPAYFTEKFEAEGLMDCRYETYPLNNITELLVLLLRRPHLQGLNVTIPYKKQVIPYLDKRSVEVEKTGACNCIKIIKGKLIGYNTDVVGFEKSLVPGLASHHTKALILGSGGAAAAVEYVLKKLGLPVTFVSRQKSAADCLSYGQLNEEILNQHQLIINTTPLGMSPKVET
ncbi:MAG TPA: shikimate dehydrogenase, partial [Segetibacter sp.]